MKRLIGFFVVLLFPALLGAQTIGTPHDLFAPSSPSMQPIRDAIASKKSADPSLFADAEKIPAHVATLDKKKRGPILPLAQPFKALGKEMTLPLAAVVLSEYQNPTLTGSAKASFMVGVFESFAHHGDRVVVPLLFAVLQKESDRFIVRAASEAVGRLGSDAQILDLLSFAASSDDVRAGLRGCRRMACASYLATFLTLPRDKRETITAIKALGSIGNAWAWKTTEVKSKDDGESVRRFAAEKLVAYYAAATDDDIRAQARKSILVVDHPATPQFIAAARKSLGKVGHQKMDDLTRRFDKNPIR